MDNKPNPNFVGSPKISLHLSVIQPTNKTPLIIYNILDLGNTDHLNMHPKLHQDTDSECVLCCVSGYVLWNLTVIVRLQEHLNDAETASSKI